MAGGWPLESLIENEGEDDAMSVRAVVRAFLSKRVRRMSFVPFDIDGLMNSLHCSIDYTK